MKEDQLLKSLIRQYSSSNKRIHNSTSIAEHFKTQEQKGIDFIQTYSTQFNVDISALETNKYLRQGEETEDQEENKNLKKLTFEDLMKGIRVGELNEDVIEFEDNDPNLPLKFTAKNIILGTIFVIIISTILSFIAVYI